LLPLGKNPQGKPRAAQNSDGRFKRLPIETFLELFRPRRHGAESSRTRIELCPNI